MKNTLIFIAFVLVVLGLLYAVSGRRVEPRPIPIDSRHEAVKDPKICMDCHGPGKDAAMKRSHPPKYECFKCHKEGGKK